MNVKWDDRGLVVAVAQDRITSEVRMVAWMNEAALRATRESGFATFYSRSRAELWQKGSTSGNRLRVQALTADCDGDTLLLSVDPEGPSCHTGHPSCFFSALDGRPQDPGPYLLELEAVIAARASSTAERSYTRALLEAGADKIGSKLAEEAGELAHAISDESREPSTRPEYRGGIGEDGVAALKALVAAGGTLVMLGNACDFAIERFPLSVRNLKRGLTRDQHFAPARS